MIVANLKQAPKVEFDAPHAQERRIGARPAIANPSFGGMGGREEHVLMQGWNKKLQNNGPIKRNAPDWIDTNAPPGSNSLQNQSI